MKRSMLAFTITTLALAGAARAEEHDDHLNAAAVVDSAEEAPKATTVAREGQMLPLTISPTIGHKQVLGVFLGGYDSAPGQGPQFSALVEGQLFNHVALRVGVDYQDAIHSVYPSVGVRVGILRQDKYKVDLAVVGQYKNLGFSEATGEFELGVMIGHRWNKVGLYGNAIFGQGLTPDEHDVEGRIAALYFAHPRVNVGLDVRARKDLGNDSTERSKKGLVADFDLLAGAVAQATVLKHLVVMAEVGPHVLIVQEKAQAGVMAVGGVGATY